jgi:hypothetical protein
MLILMLLLDGCSTLGKSQRIVGEGCDRLEIQHNTDEMTLTKG